MIDRRMFKGMNLMRFALQSIQLELNSLDNYIDETAASIELKQRELEKQYQNARDENPEDDSELDMYFSDEFHRYHELFPTFTFNSILVSQFSFFESRLKFLCELNQRKKFSNVKLSDLNGSEIEKCKRYLTLVAELDFDIFQDKWKRIIDIQKLRNAIIHNSSKIINEKANISIISIIKSDNRIEYVEKLGNFYIKDVSFLREFSKLLLDFFTLLVDRLAKTKVIARNTTMPYDNTVWGQEKTEGLLQDVIHGLKILKDNETRNDEFKDSDLKANIKGILGSMVCDLTKLYAFFCDGDWETKDSEIVIESGIEGLAHLEKVYKQK